MARYVLMTLHGNVYLATLDEKLTTSKRYDDAITFDSKEEAIEYLFYHKESIAELGYHWTTREYFDILK